MTLLLKNVTKRFDDKLILKDIFLELNLGERVGLLGRNGSGKSTLLKILAGLESPDSGVVTCTGQVSYLVQRFECDARLLRDLVLPLAIQRLKNNLIHAEICLQEPTSENLEAYAFAEERYRISGGYDIEIKVEKIFSGLGLDGEWQTDTLSGGQTRRAMLARLLVEPANYYLLDEPTNDLDFSSIQWLCEWIKFSEAGFLIVSHDRDFLDSLVQRCYELQRNTLSEYFGNFSQAMTLKRSIQENQKEAFDAQQRKINALRTEALELRRTATIAGKFDVKKKKWGNLISAKSKAEDVSRTIANRAKALEKRIDQMLLLDMPIQEKSVTRINISNIPRGPDRVLTIDNLTLTRSDRLIIDRLSLHVRRGERIGLMGPNGSGKSSFLKVINRDIPVTEGKVEFGSDLVVFWASQNAAELREFPSIGSAILDAGPNLKTQQVFALLASLGLPANPSSLVATLSGGQLTRLALARLSVTKAHLLLLDEPTNNLDIEAVEALEKLLIEYPGTIIFATHDKRLLENVATKVLELPFKCP
jgi:ATPase subunit of ABC transporter with duplicated ATPase domains